MTQAFTAAQLHDLKFELQVERARLQRALSPYQQDVEHSHEHSGSGGGTATMNTTRMETETRYAAILAALDRMEKGTYGPCTECGDIIAFGRLLVMPEATHCVGCHPRS